MNNMFGIVKGLECDYYDDTTIEVQPGIWTAAGKFENPRLFPNSKRIFYPNDVVGESGNGWYRLFIVHPDILILHKSDRYTAEVGKGREQRKLPIVFYVHGETFVNNKLEKGKIIPWQQYGKDIYWTAASIYDDKYCIELTNAGNYQYMTDVQLKLVPSESRLAHMLILAEHLDYKVNDIKLGNKSAEIKTPGVTSCIPVGYGYSQLQSFITNSTQHIRINLNPRTKIRICTRGWQWREPIQ